MNFYNNIQNNLTNYQILKTISNNFPQKEYVSKTNANIQSDH